MRLIRRPRGRSVIAWGRDFRPDYLRLGELRDRYTGVPWMLLTATLPTQLRVQLFGALHLDPTPNPSLTPPPNPDTLILTPSS